MRFASLVGKASHVVHFHFGAGSAKGAINPKFGLGVVKGHGVPAMQADPTGDIFNPVRLMRPVGPEPPQQGFQFIGRWQPIGFIHTTILPLDFKTEPYL